jgi:hypothetical protein
MNCNEFHVELNRALENRVSVDCTELIPHTLACEECRVVWEDCLLLEPSIQNWNDRTIRDVNLVDGVIDQLRDLGAPTTQPSKPVSTQKSTNSNRAYYVVTLAMCLLVACVIALNVGGNGSRVADNGLDPQVVPDDLSNGPFNRENKNQNVDRKTTQVALLKPSEIRDMMEDARNGIASLGDSVAQQMAGITDIVPSNFEVWDEAPEQENDNVAEPDTESPNPWLKRLFDTADAFDPETT